MVTKISESERGAFSRRLNELLDESGVAARGRPAEMQRIWRSISGETISITSTRKWLTGEAMPGTTKLGLLAKALGCRADWLLGGGGSKSDTDQGGYQVSDHSSSYQDKPIRQPVSGIDRALLRSVIAMVERNARSRGLTLSITERAAIIAGVYSGCVEEGYTADTVPQGMFTVAYEAIRS
ncbi:hypothetical protein [Nitrincola sp. MINF-07-Sa-05]|uniref:hypothetical protein n=1 Tax=Nitrincola salilacus TaxID=3400273 RepID=UPI0039184E4B